MWQKPLLPVIIGRCSFKATLQVIEKNNKKLKGTSTLLGTRRLNFDRARSFWLAKLGAWLAIDFEAWDRDHTVLLEFGYSSVQWHDGQKIEDKGHLIVKEHKKYFNTYVPNFREVRVTKQDVAPYPLRSSIPIALQLWDKRGSFEGRVQAEDQRPHNRLVQRPTAVPRFP